METVPNSDYTEWRRGLFDDMSAEEFDASVIEYRKSHPKKAGRFPKTKKRIVPIAEKILRWSEAIIKNGRSQLSNIAYFCVVKRIQHSGCYINQKRNQSQLQT